MAKIKYHSRKFLNKTTGIAAIEVNLECYAWSSGGVDATVSISDCSRHINLDFSVYSKKDLDARIQKLDLLITELTKLQEMFIDNSYDLCNAMDEAAKKRKENNKKRDKPKVVEIEL
jgi:hypothetical protein